MAADAEKAWLCCAVRDAPARKEGDAAVSRALRDGVTLHLWASWPNAGRIIVEVAI